MNRKTVAIVVLTITAMMLSGVIVQGLRETPAFAQAPRAGDLGSGRYSDYVVVPLHVDENTDILCITDTITMRMLFFEYDVAGKTLKVFGSGVQLKKDL